MTVTTKKGTNKIKRGTNKIKKNMITTRKGTNYSKKNIELQELPHIVARRKRMEEEQKAQQHKTICATMLADKPKKNENFCPMHQTKKKEKF